MSEEQARGYSTPAEAREKDGQLTFYTSLNAPEEEACETQHSPLGNVIILRVGGIFFAGACYPRARKIIRKNGWVTTIDLHRRILNCILFELAALLKRGVISWEKYNAELALLDRSRMCLQGYHHKMNEEVSERLFRG